MDIIGGLKDKVTSYIDVRVKLLKLNFILRTSNVLSYLMFAMIGLFVLLCIILFIGFAIADVCVEMGCARVVATLISIGFYVLLLLLLMACRRPITRYFSSRIIVAMTEGDDEEDGDDDEDD